MNPISIAITENSIDEAAVLQGVRDPDCGANVLFVGTTRRMTGQTETRTLWYEHYRGFAEKELERLCRTTMERWPVRRIAVVHRVGEVPPGESSIAVAVSSPHRVEGFAAAQWIMDEIKRCVPVWKKERLADGQEVWVHPGVTGPENEEKTTS